MNKEHKRLIKKFKKLGLPQDVADLETKRVLRVDGKYRNLENQNGLRWDEFNTLATKIHDER